MKPKNKGLPQKKNYSKKPNRYVRVKRQIEKNKESEEALKRQQKAILDRQAKRDEEEIADEPSSSEGEEELNLFSHLLSDLKKSSKEAALKEIEQEESDDDQEVNEKESTDNEEVESESEENSDNEDPEESPSVDNNYVRHYQCVLSQQLFTAISSAPPQIKTTNSTWPALEDIIIQLPECSRDKKIRTLEDDEEGSVVKEAESLKIFKSQTVLENCLEKGINLSKELSAFQMELASIIFSYKDFYFGQRNFNNEDEIKSIYCAHVLNHILKARKLVTGNNRKLASKTDNDDDNALRDQGFTNSKVLILLPFRESANQIVENIATLLVGEDKSKVYNYKRFLEEFTGNNLSFPKVNKKPEDYEKTFAGNTDDTFRIGISIIKRSHKNTLKLYTPFESSDLIIASPLGLRMVLAEEGESNSDFLSSIELLILDQMDIFIMQNWDHVHYILDRLHLQPKSRGETDFSRIRWSYINGWSKYYRQTLLFSSHDLPEFRSLLNARCRNFRGKVRNEKKFLKGNIFHVLLKIPQTFHRIDVNALDQIFDARFEYFINEILPKFRPSTMAHCMIYVPSYFDYVRLRNHFKKECINFTQINEYTKPDKVSRARTMFYHGSSHFLLYSERAHFYHRRTIKGVRHIIFYQPPTFGNFYNELLNLMRDQNQNPNDNVMTLYSATALYTKYDILTLSPLVGNENAAKLLNSKKLIHNFVAEC